MKKKENVEEWRRKIINKFQFKFLSKILKFSSILDWIFA